ncbi:zinc dependent phospholipase C family protein [Flaviaesturariibacter amylovorans]|uniref:S1/P1 Nuclease n=1 Tax=Flaviaesturariibacter amylovorans TaxID=1084520 RepID=A0ABP8G488_9BACT
MSKLKRLLLLGASLCLSLPAACWGFWGHRQINYYAVFLLPPELIAFYKPHITYLSEHAVDPDMRRYLVPAEGPRHYIDIDRYGSYPYPDLPRRWDSAVARYGKDTLEAHGTVPWWVPAMQARLTQAFKEGDAARILKLSAELGHYIGDAHVPLHASSNHNGQKTGQHGIHGLWESRVPELLAREQWSFVIGHAGYIENPSAYIWDRVLESAAAADTVLRLERELSLRYPAQQKVAYEERNGKLTRQYAEGFVRAYDRSMKGMVERRMRAAIYAVASFWYTAWVDAGQPDLKALVKKPPTPEEEAELKRLHEGWRNGAILGRSEEH